MGPQCRLWDVGANNCVLPKEGVASFSVAPPVRAVPLADRLKKTQPEDRAQASPEPPQPDAVPPASTVPLADRLKKVRPEDQHETSPEPQQAGRPQPVQARTTSAKSGVKAPFVLGGIVAFVILGIVFFFVLNKKVPFLNSPIQPAPQAKGPTEKPVQYSERERLFASLKSDAVLTTGVELIDANKQRGKMPSCIEVGASKYGNVFKADFCRDGRTEYVFCSQDDQSRSGYEKADIIVAEEKSGKMSVNARHSAHMPTLNFAGDFDGDGRIEVIAFDNGGGSSGLGRTYVISFAKGTPEFLPMTGRSEGVDGGVLSALDIDKDGRFELIVPNGGSCVGANNTRESWYDLVNWDGNKSVTVTTRFRDFYSRTFVPYWEAVGKGKDDAAKNCHVLLARFRDTFSNPAGVSQSSTLAPAQRPVSASPSVSSISVTPQIVESPTGPVPPPDSHAVGPKEEIEAAFAHWIDANRRLEDYSYTDCFADRLEQYYAMTNAQKKDIQKDWDAARRVFDSCDIEVLNLSIVLDGASGLALFDKHFKGNKKSGGFYECNVRTRVGFRKINGAWKIISLQEVKVNWYDKGNGRVYGK